MDPQGFLQDLASN